MNVIEKFIAKMKNINKFKKEKKFCPEIIPLVKEFPFVCGLDVELTQKNKKFTNEAKSFAETLLNQFPFIKDDYDLISDIFQVLAIVGSFNGDIPHSHNYQQIVTIILEKISEKEDSHSYVSFLSTLCMFKTFVECFFFSDYFPSLFDQLMISETECEAFMQLTTIFSNIVKFHSSSKKSVAFIEHALDSITKKKYNTKSVQYGIIFLSSYVEKVSKVDSSFFSKFNKMNGVEICYETLKENSPENIRRLLKFLLKSSNGSSKNNLNVDVEHFLTRKLEEETNEIRNILVLTIHDVVEDKSVDINKLEAEFCFSEIFSKFKDEDGLQSNFIELMQVLVSRGYKKSTEIFFTIIKSENYNSYLVKISKTLEEGLMNNVIEINVKCSSDLYNFFQKMPQKQFIDLFSSYESFSELLIRFYKISGNLQNDVFSNICTLVSAPEADASLNKLISSMIMTQFDTKKLHIFIQQLTKQFTVKLFTSLIPYFKESIDNVNFFIKIEGLSRMRDIFNNKELPDDVIADVLIAMSSHRFNKKLNKSILNLRDEDRIFHLSKRMYRRIILNKRMLNPIRLPVLVPLLDFPPETDLNIDAINLKTYAIPIYLRIKKDVPRLPKIVQKYVEANHANNIMKNFKVEQYTEESNEDFPIYEFCPHSNHTSITAEIPFFGFSFWFKVSYKRHQNLQIFKSNDVVLTLNGDVMTIKWGDDVEKQTVELGKWHFVFVSSNAWMFGTLVNVMIDQTEYKFQKEQLFRNFEIGSNNSPCEATWCVSGNMRVFISLFRENSSVITLRERGPGNLDVIKSEDIIGIQSDSFTLGEDVFYIPSKSISSYINEPLFVSQLFATLRQAKTKNELIYEFESCLAIAKNSHFVNDLFWYYLIITLKVKKDIISSDVYIILIDFLKSNVEKDVCIDIIRSTFFDIELWNILKEKDQKIVLDSLKDVLLGENFSDLATIKGMIPFLFLIALKTDNGEISTRVYSIIAEICMKRKMYNCIRTLFAIAFYCPSKGKVKCSNSLVTCLISYFNKFNDISIYKNIKPQWITYYIQHSKDDIGVTIAIDLINKLRKTNEEFEIEMEPCAPKIIGNMIVWHNFVTLLLGPEYSCSYEESLHYKVNEKVFGFVLSYFISSFDYLITMKMTNQGFPDQLLMIIKDGADIFNHLCKTNPELFKDEKTIALLSFLFSLPFGTIDKSVDEILSKCDSLMLRFTVKKEDLESIVDGLFEIHDITDNMKTAFINMLDIDSYCQETIENVGFILDTIEYFSELAKGGTPNYDYDGKEIADLFNDLGVLKFIISVVHINSDAKIAGKIVRSCISFYPFNNRGVSSYLVTAFIDHFLEERTMFTWETAKAIEDTLVDDIYYSKTRKFDYRVIQSFIELHKMYELDKLETAMWAKLVQNMEENYVGKYPNTKNYDLKFAATLYAVKHSDDEEGRKYLNELIKDDIYKQKLTELITNDIDQTDNFVNDVFGRSGEYSKDLIEKLENYVSNLESKIENKSEYRINLVFDIKSNEINESNLELQRSLTHILPEFLQLTTFLSMRQNECFSLNVLLAELQAKQSNKEDFSPKSYRYGGFSKPNMFPVLIRPVFDHKISIKSSSESAEAKANELDIIQHDQNKMFIEHSCDTLCDPNDYAQTFLKSQSLMYYAFLRRFFKFGECKESMNAFINFYEQKIPCIIFVMSPAIMILIHSTKIVDQMNLLGADDSSDNEEFLNEIYDGEFGSFTTFNSHFVLIVNPYDIYSVNTDKNKTIFIYRLNSKTLSLSFNGEIPEKLISSFESGSKYNKRHSAPNFLTKKTIGEVYSQWINDNISSIKMILLLNKETKRDLFSTINPVVVPKASIKNNPNIESSRKIVKDIAALCIPDAFGMNQSSIYNKYFVECLKEFGLRDKHKSTKKKLHVKLEKLHHHSIILPNGTIYNIRGKPTIYIHPSGEEFPITLFNSEYSQIKSFGVTNDYQFMVIDFIFGISTVFQIIYKEGALTDISKIGSIVTGEGSVSSISSEYMLCVSVHQSTIIIWDFMKQTIHRIVELPFAGKLSAFDENNGYLWVCGYSQVALVTINGTHCSTLNLDNKIMNIVPNSDLSAIILLEDDSLIRVEYSGKKFLSFFQIQN